MRIITDLTEEEFERLQKLSAEERRPLRDQAAWLLSRAIRAESEREFAKATAGRGEAATDGQ